MRIYDQHLHSNYSFDSKEKLSSYVNKHSKNMIVTTEHLDFGNPVSNYADSIPDFQKYSREINKLNNMSGVKLFKGIEIGYIDSYEQEILDYLRGKDFSVRLLSVHQNGQYDFMQKEILKNNTIRNLVNEYYLLVIKALESHVEADIFAHFDYGLRQIAITADTLSDYAEDKINKVLDLVIKKELSFELNTKSMYRYHKLSLYDMVVDKYIRKGGKLFSIGSDSHNIDYYAHGYLEAVEFLENKGIKEVVFYDESREFEQLN